jgi:hypothetical protein
MRLDIIDTAAAESAAEGFSRIALGVEYKGARYRGWQRQASGVPVSSRPWSKRCRRSPTSRFR